MKSLLITGGAGFIGSAFTRYVFKNYPDIHIIVLDALTYAGNMDNFPREIKESARFEFWYGNLNNLDLVSELVSRSDWIAHFAAETHVARSLYSNRIFSETDVLGTQSVANAVLRWMDRVERFVHISSSEVYGTARYEPMDENHPIEPTSPYAAAKAGADRLIYSYVATYDIPAVILRPFNTYGPYQHLEKVIPRFITSAILDEPLTVHGTGEASRDWVYVEDTARAADLALRAPLETVKGQVFNVGTQRSLSVLEIADLVLEIMGKPKTLITYAEDRLGQVVRHFADTSKTRRILAFETSVTFEKGLQRTIQWYKDNRGWWERLLSFRKVPVKLRTGKVVWY